MEIKGLKEENRDFLAKMNRGYYIEEKLTYRVDSFARWHRHICDEASMLQQEMDWIIEKKKKKNIQLQAKICLFTKWTAVEHSQP